MKRYSITVNGNAYDVIVEEVSAAGASIPTPVAPVTPIAPVAATPAPAAAPVAAPAPAAAPSAAPAGNAGGTKVTSPMPGTILDIKVSVGQSVKKGDVICVLEAMKMENDIPAPADGVVASINVQKGATVAANDILASLN